MASRRAQLAEARLDAAEATYVAVLRAALEECAAGRWGLFGQNPGTDGDDRYRPTALDELRALAKDIDAMRGKLGFDPFALHARFESLRGRRDENQPGEPKVARQTARRTSIAPSPGDMPEVRFPAAARQLLPTQSGHCRAAAGRAQIYWPGGATP